MIRELLELARLEGVSHEENLPFWFEPAPPARASVVLVHGFSATPREMRPLADALVEKGFSVLGVRLPGHGTSPEDLSHRKYTEWITTVSKAIELASRNTPQVYAAGLSTGSLALLAASCHHHLQGMILMAPFLRLHHPMAPFVWFLKHMWPYETRQVEKELEPFYYARRPLKAVHQLMLLIKHVRSLLPELTTPTLVFASEGDTTADHNSAVSLFKQLGSEKKELKLFGADVPHTMLGTNNPRREEVIRQSIDFYLGIDRTVGSYATRRADAEFNL